jgi:hypothetical protein
MRLSYLFCLGVVGGALACAQAPQAPAPSKGADEVKTYCASLDDYKHDTTPQLFADAGDQPKPMWRRVGTERELESLTDAQFAHAYTARVWTKDGKVVAVDTDATAGAGDWSLAAEYCYRADGTLAALHSEFRNETDDYISIRDESFDSAGASVASSQQVFDTRSHKPKKLNKQAAANEQQPPSYHKPADLPFFRLIKLQ